MWSKVYFAVSFFSITGVSQCITYTSNLIWHLFLRRLELTQSLKASTEKLNFNTWQSIAVPNAFNNQWNNETTLTIKFWRKTLRCQKSTLNKDTVECFAKFVWTVSCLILHVRYEFPSPMTLSIYFWNFCLPLASDTYIWIVNFYILLSPTRTFFPPVKLFYPSNSFCFLREDLKA